MNEKAKISISWIVTVVFVPVIGFMGVRMINSIDDIASDIQEMKTQQAVFRTEQAYMKTQMEHLSGELDNIRKK